MRYSSIKIFTLFFVLMMSACSSKTGKEKLATSDSKKLFNSIPSTYSGLDFKNNINENEQINYYKYPYLYNGGGVGIGDINTSVHGTDGGWSLVK